MTAGARSLAPPEASAPRCSTRLLWLCNDRRRRLLNSSPFCTSPVHLAFEKAVELEKFGGADEEWCLQERWSGEPLGPRTEIVVKTMILAALCGVALLAGPAGAGQIDEGICPTFPYAESFRRTAAGQTCRNACALPYQNLEP